MFFRPFVAAQNLFLRNYFYVEGIDWNVNAMEQIFYTNIKFFELYATKELKFIDFGAKKLID